MLNITPNESVRTAWNKGKLVGQKRPLQPKHVWAKCVKMHNTVQFYDLEMQNCNVQTSRLIVQ